jgi:hypothetical protein
MSSELLAAVLSGLVSGLVGGFAASSLHIRFSRSSHAQSSGPAVTGRSHQTASATGSSFAAATRKGNITHNVSSVTRERRPQIAARVLRKTGAGLPSQVIVIENLGQAAAEDLVLQPAPDGGGFMVQPNWAAFPQRLPGGQPVEAPCVTTGRGMVAFLATYRDEDQPMGPLLIQATHE